MVIAVSSQALRLVQWRQSLRTLSRREWRLAVLKWKCSKKAGMRVKRQTHVMPSSLA